jgi:putative transposase
MCRALKVSKSGFYGWRGRAPSARARADALLSERIALIHADSRETYGAPRIHFELRTLGVRCARKRVARLMREASLFGCGGRRKKARTTLRSPTDRTPPAPDLVRSATSLRRLQTACGSRTHHIRENLGRLALPLVRLGHLLAKDRRMVHGEQPENRDRARCPEHGAIYTRRPEPGLIHHSDRGSQYTSVEFTGRLREAGLLPSMGSVADAYDNLGWPRVSSRA